MFVLNFKNHIISLTYLEFILDPRMKPIPTAAHMSLLLDRTKLLQGSIDVGVTRSLCVAYSEPVWLLYGLTRSIRQTRVSSW
jgi:hypothetical protein